MVDAVTSSSSAPSPSETGGKLDVEGDQVELDVESDAGSTSAPVEEAPESERGNNVDVEA